MQDSDFVPAGTPEEKIDEQNERPFKRFGKLQDLTDEEASEHTRLERVCVQIYTGNGKGKTTCSLGLALRAKGYGLDVRVIQFGKDKRCSEHVAAEKIGIPIYLCEGGRGRNSARAQYELAREFIENDACDVLIMDETMHALKCGWITLDEVLGLIEKKPPQMELVLTGRNAPQELIDAADLVTEMTPIKHYIDAGVDARRGIEY